MSNDRLAENKTLHTFKKPFIQKFGRIIKTGFKLLFSVLLIYILVLLVGLVPVNNDFEEANFGDGVEIFISSNAVHADIVVPIANETIDWRTIFAGHHFQNDISSFSHVAIGWGDKGFFVETPTWGDLKLSTAAFALLWSSPTCIHVSLKRKAFLPADLRRVRISVAQYQKLVEYIQSTIQFENEAAIVIAAAEYGRSDAFFEAWGNYHAFNTCNSWVGGGLKECGVRVPWLSPMPKTPFLYLPE